MWVTSPEAKDGMLASWTLACAWLVSPLVPYCESRVIQESWWDNWERLMPSAVMGLPKSRKKMECLLFRMRDSFLAPDCWSLHFLLRVRGQIGMLTVEDNWERHAHLSDERTLQFLAALANCYCESRVKLTVEIIGRSWWGVPLYMFQDQRHAHLSDERTLCAWLVSPQVTMSGHAFNVHSRESVQRCAYVLPTLQYEVSEELDIRLWFKNMKVDGKNDGQE